MLFTEINLIEPIQKALVKSKYVTATPIQSQAIPHILAGKDLFGIAQTGTGKTAAFTLPILQLMFNQNRRLNTPRTLILAPTRELAAQIGESINEYGAFTKFRQTVIFGGVGQYAQEKSLQRGVDIIIATPGRLLDLIEQGHVNLSTIEFFILDEADRMLDMGFINDVKKIIAKLPKKKQSLFFSATMSNTVLDLAKNFLNNPIKVEVTPQATTVQKIEQGVYFVDKDDKDKLLFEIIKPKRITSVLVFTRTKHKADRICEYLRRNNIKSDAIHGNKSQPQRVNALNNFKTGEIKALVATDIAARGIDIDNISHVINYELPVDPESYVHRIGRTARAGQDGIAYSFCSADERDYLRDIERLIKRQLPVMEHDRHSNFAENATGKDARPLPKGKQRDGARSGMRDSRNKSSGGNGNGAKSSGNRDKKSNKPKGNVSGNKENSNSNSSSTSNKPKQNNFKSKFSKSEEGSDKNKRFHKFKQNNN